MSCAPDECLCCDQLRRCLILQHTRTRTPAQHPLDVAHPWHAAFGMGTRKQHRGAAALAAHRASLKPKLQPRPDRAAVAVDDGAPKCGLCLASYVFDTRRDPHRLAR